MKNEEPLIRIVDDDEDVLASLKVMLECEGFAVAAYSSGATMLAELDPGRPGCVLLDVRMPGLAGPEVQERLNDARTQLPVIFLTSYAEIEVAVTTLKRGAEDFLIKPVDPERLLGVIREAIGKDLERRRARVAPDVLKGALDRLTDRPKTVLRLMLDHLNDARIAERLGLSERTVQVYRQQVYKAFGVHSLKAFEAMADDIRLVMEKTVHR